MCLPVAPEEGPFTFPNGEAVEHSEESKDRTIVLMGVSSQKISVRLKRTAAHKATQTESLPWLGSEGPSGPCVPPSPRKTAQDTLYVLPSPTSPCPSPVLVRKRAFVKWENKESLIKSKEELRHLRLPTYQELEQVTSFPSFSDFERSRGPGSHEENRISWAPNCHNGTISKCGCQGSKLCSQ